ncbi:universal stress protein [Halopenitus sp. H-Gu1]|uniref:universal stress protein n=1 Tax=Halopenitus sp. H-Gu1 TaxID=3242697 RepID=UPI00359DED74
MVGTPQIIIPVSILEGHVVSETLIEFLSSVPIVVLGYHEIPEQTLPEQAQDEFGDRASEELADLEDAFESYDATVETELVFTHDLAQAIQQVVEDVDRGVVCHPNPVQNVENVLVEVRRPELVPAITATITALVGPTDATITLLYAGDEDEETGHRTLSGIATTLEEAGISDQRISQVTERTADPETTILDRADRQDLFILGEDDPSFLNWIFGEMSERIAERTLAPVLVVQRPFEE